MHAANSDQILKKNQRKDRIMKKKYKSQLSSYVTSLFLGKVPDNSL
jgi:hypothetical protein